MSDLVVRSTVNFFGDPIPVVEVEREVDGNKERILAVVLRPFLEGLLDLNWGSQLDKIKSNPTRWAPFSVATESGDGKVRDMICVPYTKINALINGINTNQVPDDVMVDMVVNGETVKVSKRERLIAYQDECAMVLHDYWNHGFAMNFRSNPTQFDAEMSYNILEGSQRRFKQSLSALGDHVVSVRGTKQGPAFDAEVADFLGALEVEVVDNIKTIIGAKYLNMEEGRIRLSGETDIRFISGREACDVTLLMSCFSDLVSKFRRGELSDNYEDLFEALPEYFNNYLKNTGSHYIRMHNTYREGRGIL